MIRSIANLSVRSTTALPTLAFAGFRFNAPALSRSVFIKSGNSPLQRFLPAKSHQRSYHNNNQYHHYEQQAAEESIAPSQPLLLAVGGYFVLINAFAVGLFWYDKHQAQTKGWRIPEKQLQLTALLGGWIGGTWAMKTFKHKTVKKEFKEPYNLAMMANWAILGGIAGAWVLLPRFRRNLQAKVKGIMP
ncbi:UNVERIFIED_CONTAM: hypothetical protein HDU68_010613 [Siphonaria sp. JEL0065]|nr:hypothetical protein HDU68_010613 [Siphonaria sp. JEL0065]